MAYQLVSECTSTYGPTVQGLALLKRYFFDMPKFSQDSDWNSLEQLLTFGVTDNPQALATQCVLLMHYVNSSYTDDQLADIQSSLLHIAGTASRSKECLALCS